MENIAFYAKELTKATFWFGCAAILALMTIMIIIGTISGELQNQPLNDKALEVLHDMKEADKNPPQYYY